METTTKFNYNQIFDFIKKYQVVFLILIAISLSVFMRLQPAYLPITDNWAEQSVHNSIRSQILTQVNERYPNLYEDKKAQLIEDELNKQLDTNKASIDLQIQQTSEYFKTWARNENGDNYLNDIDTWVFYYYTKRLIEHGHVGNYVKDGQEWQLVPAPIGSPITIGFPVYLEYYAYKIVHFFNKDVDLMVIVYFLPLLICALCVFPAFFIARKKGGNFGGFIAAVVIAIMPAFLARTVVGVVDTDPYNVLFPLFIIWFFLEALDAKTLRNKVILGLLSSATLAFYSWVWTGYFFVADFMIGLSLTYIAYLFLHDYLKDKKLSLKTKTRDTIILFVTFLSGTVLLTWLISGFNTVLSIINGPLDFVRFKSVGVANIWPNVFTTVAEQNSSSFDAVVHTMGGSLIFALAVLGILLMILKKDQDGHYDIAYSILFTAWFVGTVYASIKGVRFTLLLAPIFALALGIFFGITYQYLSKIISREFHFNEIVAKVLIIIMLCLLLLYPRNMFIESYSTAVHQFPLMNDIWYDSLLFIRDNADNDSIVTTWWDYCHWVRAVAEKPITFDGGSQNSPMAHWVGKLFLSSDEDESVAILRMLDCGSYLGEKKLEEYSNLDTLTSVELIKELIMLDKQDAKKVLLDYMNDEQAEEVLNLTHCTPPKGTLIVSDDMVGKSPVWSHFGSWNFTKADILNKVNTMSSREAKQYFKDRFNYTDKQATDIYNEAKSVGTGDAANSWIAPWYSYASTPIGCSKINNDTLSCTNGLFINTTSHDAYFENGFHPKTFTYIDNDTVTTRHYNESIFISNGRELGISLQADNTIIFADSEIGGSMFNRLYYMDGIGLEKHFKKIYDSEYGFNGNRVSIYEVNWK